MQELMDLRKDVLSNVQIDPERLAKALELIRLARSEGQTKPKAPTKKKKVELSDLFGEGI